MNQNLWQNSQFGSLKCLIKIFTTVSTDLFVTYYLACVKYVAICATKRSVHSLSIQVSHLVWQKCQPLLTRMNYPVSCYQLFLLSFYNIYINNWEDLSALYRWLNGLIQSNQIWCEWMQEMSLTKSFFVPLDERELSLRVLISYDKY